MGKKTKVKKGDKYTCGVCGLVVTVDDACGCVNFCDIICCGEQMERPKASKKKAGKKKTYGCCR